jgi:hypothetical protein
MYRSDTLTTLMCRLSRNPGALTSPTPQGHVGLFRWLLYFTFRDLLFRVVELWDFIASNRMKIWDMCIKSDAVK